MESVTDYARSPVFETWPRPGLSHGFSFTQVPNGYQAAMAGECNTAETEKGTDHSSLLQMFRVVMLLELPLLSVVEYGTKLCFVIIIILFTCAIIRDANLDNLNCDFLLQPFRRL